MALSKCFVAMFVAGSVIAFGTLSRELVAQGRGDAGEEGRAVQKWGSLSGIIRVEGGIEPPRGEVRKYKDRAGKLIEKKVVSEEVVIDKKSRGLANVVVWIATANAGDIPVHPSYAKSNDIPAAATIRYGRWRPHVILLQTSQRLIVASDDNVHRELGYPFYAGSEPIASVSRSRGYYSRRYECIMNVPQSFRSLLYPWETGVLFVKEHPYVTASKSDGSFVLNHVPAGTWKLKFWHEKTGYLPAAYHDGNKRIDDKGAILLSVRPDRNQLGAFVVDAKSLSLRN